MLILVENTQKLLSDAFAACGVTGVNAVLSPSDRADFQCNAALSAAKKLGLNPVELAEKVIKIAMNTDGEKDSSGPPLTMDVSGPGFINITVVDSYLNLLAVGDLAPAAKPEKQTIYLDFGGPNIAKPMHVGHLRSLVIGDSLQRMLRFVGHDVVSDIHLGDFGLQMGLLLVQLKDEKIEDITLEMLEAAYPLATARSKEDAAFKLEAQQATLKLQAGFDNHVEIERWKHFIKLSMDTVNRELVDLGILFTLYKGESDAQKYIPPTLGKMFEAGIVETEPNDGPVLTRVTEPPFILMNSEGAALYSLTDLATIFDRARYADQIIYVVDQRQSLHFQQLFTVSDVAGIYPKDKLTHVGFGTVNGPDGRPLKTRDGGSPKLHDLIVAAKEEASKRNPEAADMVAIAALKFADLQNARTSSYVFDLDKFLSFEGKTGPYMLYQCVRIKALLAKNPGYENGGSPNIGFAYDPAERELAKMLAFGFSQALEKSIEKLSPKEMADYAYDLAQTFSKFYAALPIAGNPYRLMLAKRTLDLLEQALFLLGIEVPEAM